MNKRIMAMIAAVMLILAVCQQKTHATGISETTPHIVEETYIPIEDHTFDNKGYLNMRALPPVGFAGAVCVDIKNLNTGEMQTEKLEYMNAYIGGVWLTEGRYEIQNPRPETGNYFLVESSTAVVDISHDEQASIELVVRPNPETLAQFEQAHADFKEKKTSMESTSDSIQNTQPSTVTAPDTSTVALTEPLAPAIPVDESDSQIHSNASTEKNVAANLIVSLIALALFVGGIFLTVWILKKKYK